MSLHPLLWIIVGALVTFVSWFVGDKMVIFMYLGIIFFAFGVFRAVIRFTKPSPTPRKRYVCFSCKNPVDATQKFCTGCGTRIRK